MSGAQTVVSEHGVSPKGWYGAADLSADGQYRYSLRRSRPPMLLPGHAPRPEPLVFVMLNPSDATATVDDHTIGRLYGFAASERHNRFDVVNLYGWRTPQPTVLLRMLDAAAKRTPGADDPVGALNDKYLLDTCAGVNGTLQPRVVIAWGALHPRFVPRAAAVLRLLQTHSIRLHVMGEPTKEGHPRHPLFLPADTKIRPARFAPPKEAS